MWRRCLQETRAKLPIWAAQQRLLQAMDSAPVVLVVGETGSGKSTQVSQFILDSYLTAGRGAECSIICTQPRRIAAVSLAERIASERAERCGGRDSLVGYHIRLEAKATADTRLLLCTTGILLRRLQSDPLLAGVSHVVIDEGHERDLNIDFLLVIIKELLDSRRLAAFDSTEQGGLAPLRLVVMSASFNTDLMQSYFGGDACPVVHVSGRTFSVEEHYLEDVFELTGTRIEEDSPYAKRRTGGSHTAKVHVTGAGGRSHVMNLDWDDATVGSSGAAAAAAAGAAAAAAGEGQGYSAATMQAMGRVNEDRINYDLAVDLLLAIEEGFEPGGVLVFLPGLAEIARLCEALHRTPTFGDEQRCRVLPLHSSLSAQDQARVFDPVPRGVRKVVVVSGKCMASVSALEASAFD